MTTAKEIIDIMLEMQNDGQRQILARFFKTGKGEYGEGDKSQIRHRADGCRGEGVLDEERVTYAHLYVMLGLFCFHFVLIKGHLVQAT